jgi:hypothetical protein
LVGLYRIGFEDICNGVGVRNRAYMCLQTLHPLEDDLLAYSWRGGFPPAPHDFFSGWFKIKIKLINGASPLI